MEAVHFIEDKFITHHAIIGMLSSHKFISYLPLLVSILKFHEK